MQPDLIKIRTLVDTLNSDEKQIYKSLVAGEIPECFDNNHRLRARSDNDQTKFTKISHLIRWLTPFHESIPCGGVSFLGTPPWLDNDLLCLLQNEAESRLEAKMDRGDHYLGCGGSIADALSSSQQIINFVSEHVGTVKPTGIASYLFYSLPGSGIKPHVDSEVFSVNLMLMLKHVPPAYTKDTSSTVVFPAGMDAVDYKIPVGYVMLMHGSSIVHSRTPLHAGEEIHLLTIGFNRVEDAR